jgi:hypothetical protein
VPAPTLQAFRSLRAPVPALAEPPPIEAGLAAGQVFLGALTALAVGAGNALVFAALGAPKLNFISVGVAPAAGAILICAMGRHSRFYGGDCGSSMVGGYLGAVVAGVGLGFVYYKETTTSGNSDADAWRPLGQFIFGAAVGVVVGTGIGATIGWHLGKHRRQGDAGVAVALSAPPLPPPAALADWPELRARTPAPAGGTVVGIPLLALRF